MSSPSHFRKVISVLLVLSLLVESSIASAAVTLDRAYLVKDGMDIAPLTEQKISNLSSYLTQNRSPVKSHTLFEATSGKYIELDPTTLKNPAIGTTQSDLYSYGYGKALYDSNIAIIDLPTSSSGRVTYEAPYYCDYLISSLAKYQKIGNNVCLANYAAFDAAYTLNSERTYVTVIKPNEIATADLSRFGVVVFPDIVLGRQSEVLDAFGDAGRTKLTGYVSNGGLAYFSSKSLIFADKLGLTNGIIDDSLLIKHRENQGKILLSSGTTFESQVLNAGLYEGKTYTATTGSGYYDYLLGSYFIKASADPAVVPVRYFDIESDSNYYFQDLTNNEDAELDAKNNIAAFYKPVGKGLLIYNGGNSLFSTRTLPNALFRNHALNAFLLSYMREIKADAKVIQKSNPDVKENLVPSLEKNLILEYSFAATNVYKEAQNDLILRIKIAPGGLSISEALPSDCALSGTTEVDCVKPSLASGETWKVSFGITVDEPSFTQAGTAIEVTRTTLDYLDSKSTAISQNLSRQTIDATPGASMRAVLNIDPAGYYPLPGAWVYVDQILNASNNAPTEANNVDYTVTVPLISPLFDESDQSLLVSKLIFSSGYYDTTANTDTKTNIYPFKNSWVCAVGAPIAIGRCQDFVIQNKLPANSVYVDNYDEPVLRAKTDSTEANSAIASWVIADDLGTAIIKQTFMPDADKLFEHAMPRRMVYEYPAKRELLFARQDVYFYKNAAFPLPKGITDRSSFISIDSYENGDCKVQAGSYQFPTGLVANKYPNALKCGTSTKSSWINNTIDYDHLPAGVEKADYLYPIDPKNNITSIAGLAGFDADGNYIGQQDESGSVSKTYPIKMITGAYASLYLPARSTPKGGYMEITLPSDVRPTSAYVSADHIAITKTEVDGNVVRAYFYRGKMPNEQSLKSPIGIALEGVTTELGSIPVKIHSLSYNLSADPIEVYKEEQTVFAPFAKQFFLKMPAVKLAFELPRRKRVSESAISTFGLTEGQINVLFTRPEYYDKSLVFAKNTIEGINTLMTSAALSDDQKTVITSLFTATPTESYFTKWENQEPFVRFGTYIQELAFHRTVYGPLEDHPISDPGIMSDRAMFANIGNVGISPIPFSEYMTTGISQIIPLAHENGRVNYIDIFGRRFASPIRSTIPEAVPLPPPLRNFMMNTTYEMYDLSGNKKEFWDWEEELEIRENIKVYDNYPKYFDPTHCADNPTSARYGSCWDGSGSSLTGRQGQTNYTLAGKPLDSTDFYWIHSIELFTSKTAYDAFMDGLKAEMSGTGSTVDPNTYKVPTLHKVTNSDVSLSAWERINDQARNYSPEVDRYYPNGYIDNSMWNLTHFDYDDGYYAKGYPYHMDNLVPNPGTNIPLPHNSIAIPVARGSSYKHKYFQEEPSYLSYESANNGKIENNITPYRSVKYPSYRGWWSENLQNRDNTLLAGQEESNAVPYTWNGTDYLKPSLLDNSSFVRNGNPTNVYSCLFNPEEFHPSSSQASYAANTVKNNVIPIIPWIVKNGNTASLLDSYACTQDPYTNTNISKVNNIVETESAFWLYFAANLRGEAKEALNVNSRISQMPGRSYEWDVKAVEGGRFTYWNPALGPNAFEVVDNPVSIIKAKNSDVSVDHELLPYNLKNTSTDAYLLYTIKDPGELFVDANGKETPRTWAESSYTDSRGDGNYSASVTVGNNYNGRDTKSLLRPGDQTLIKVEFFNNSGYDWDMLGTGTVVNDNGQFKTSISGAIDFTVDGNEPLNANDLLFKLTRNVVAPEKYNFLKIAIPEEIKPYVTIAPSVANIRTPGTFFDFDFINVTTIRDGFKGTYFLDLTVDPSIPENLRGKVHDISLSLDPAYFDHLPGVPGKDSVSWPSVPNIPNIRFGVANPDGLAFYRNGFSTGVTLDIAYASGFIVADAEEISLDGVNALRLAAGDGTNKHRRLRETMESLSSSGFLLRSFSPTVTDNGDTSTARLNFASAGMTEFPYINASGTIVPKAYVLVHLKRPTLTDGEHPIEISNTTNFQNAAGKSKTKTNTDWLVGYAQWPKLEISYKTVLVGENKWDTLDVQKLVEGSNNVELKLFLTNTGTDVAFDPTIKVKVASGVTVSPWTIGATDIGNNTIQLRQFFAESGASRSEWEAVGPGITNFFPIYLTYSGSKSDTPITLVEQASYEFVPYDPVQGSLSGTYSTGFSLDFVKTSASFERDGADGIALTLSGNTPGIYWDVTVDGSGYFNKATNTGSLILFDVLHLDPTETHAIHTTSFFKTRAGEFRAIESADLSVTKVDAYLRTQSAEFQNGEIIHLALETNKVGRYGGYYSIDSANGSYATGSILVPNDGNIIANIGDIDTSTGANIQIHLLNASGTILATETVNLAGEGDLLTDARAARNGDKVRITFKSNKVRRGCYRIERDGTEVTPSCLPVLMQNVAFTDPTMDVFKDAFYRVRIFANAADATSILSADVPYFSPDPNLSSIPLKVLDDATIATDIAFTKTKDFGDVYIVGETPVRYAVRMKSSDGTNIVQSNSGNTVEVTYGTGQTIFVGSGWTLALQEPKVIDGSGGTDSFDQIKTVEVGDDAAPMVLDTYVRLSIHNIWEKPARVTSIHAGEQREINECAGLPKITNECYNYDVNTLDIYTKKFSTFTLWKRHITTSGGGGGNYGIDRDLCPDGDYSANYYDKTCGKAVAINNGSTGSSGSSGIVPTSGGTSSDPTSSSTGSTIKKPTIKKPTSPIKKPTSTIKKPSTTGSWTILQQGDGWAIIKNLKKNTNKIKQLLPKKKVKTKVKNGGEKK